MQSKGPVLREADLLRKVWCCSSDQSTELFQSQVSLLSVLVRLSPQVILRGLHTLMTFGGLSLQEAKQGF